MLNDQDRSIPTIGVFHATWLRARVDLRQLALLFDQLAVMELGALLGRPDELCPAALREELEWLGERDVVVEAPSFDELWNAEAQGRYAEARARLGELFDPREIDEVGRTGPGGEERLKAQAELRAVAVRLYRFTLAQSRLLALVMRGQLGCDSYPVWDDVGQALAVVGGDPNATVVNVTLTKVPMPSPETTWERILEFRGDPDTREKFRRLRLWMARAARENRSAVEVEDLLLTSLHDYEKHMRAAKVRFGYGTLQTVIVGTAEVLENLARLRLGKAAEQLFSIGERRMQLLEQELKAPGREVAYVAKAREQFKAP